MSVTCENSYLSADKQIQTLLRTNGVLNGLAASELIGGTLIPALNCNNNHLTFIDFLLLSIGVDSCGKPSLRYVTIQSCDLVKDCSNNEYDFLNSIFAFDTISETYVLVLVKPAP